MTNQIANPARNSEAHVALDLILAGAKFDQGSVRFGFADGSALELGPHGWQVAKCVLRCRCILGKREQATATVLRHRDGLVTFETEGAR